MFPARLTTCPPLIFREAGTLLPFHRVMTSHITANNGNVSYRSPTMGLRESRGDLFYRHRASLYYLPIRRCGRRFLNHELQPFSPCLPHFTSSVAYFKRTLKDLTSYIQIYHRKDQKLSYQSKSIRCTIHAMFYCHITLFHLRLEPKCV